MRRKTASKGLVVLLLLAILAIAIVILVKVNRKSNRNNNNKDRMGVDEACSLIPDADAGSCKAWAKQPGGFTKKGYVYCDDPSDPDGGNCTFGADALNCCACNYPKTVPGAKCGNPPVPSS